MRLHMHVAPQARRERQQIHLTLAGHEASKRIQAVFSEALELLGCDSYSWQARSQNTLPIGAGLGSSATLCVATLRALARSLSSSLSTAELAAYANELEKRFHGTPSGLDAAVVAYETCILFAKGAAIQAIELQEPSFGLSWEFLLIDSHVRASTLAMIRLAEPYFKGSQGDRHILAFDQLSSHALTAFKNGDWLALGAAMNECGQLLRAAGVVPASLQQMIEQCRELGLPGVKTTGAGGGGMLLCLLNPSQADLQEAAVRAIFPEHAAYRVSIQDEPKSLL
jgi:mevalonate kinase